MEKRTLYIFNPEHDLALANTNPYFQAPAAAVEMARDLALLPLWYAEKHAAVAAPAPPEAWTGVYRQLGLAEHWADIHDSQAAWSAIRPWGWDAPLRHRLAQAGIADSALPSPEAVARIKELSHRRMSRAAMLRLHEAGLCGSVAAAEELTLLAAVEAFALRYPDVVFKAPWSGSGRGIFYSRGALTDSLRGWCRNTIARQAAVMGEARYAIVDDFAMEFVCDGGDAQFAGYSLFVAEGGIYRGNRLCSDAAIIDYLSQKIDKEELIAVQETLTAFLASEFAPHYSGNIGVDMCLFRDGDECRLNPMVEINLRMTMGMVARSFYDNHVAEGHEGSFIIDRFESPAELLADHRQRLVERPLQFEEQRILHGYLSLCPIDEQTHYRVRVEIE